MGRVSDASKSMNGNGGAAAPFIHPHALVETPNIGAGTRVWAFAHVLKGASIGCDCNICDGVFVEGGAVVGDRVTVKCGVQLWDAVVLEDDTFVGPNVTFTNDPFPRSRHHLQSYRETIVRRGASIGANATILPGLVIGEDAMVGAGAVVTHDVAPRAIVAGNPARVIGSVDEHEIADSMSPERHRTFGSARMIDITEIVDDRGALTFGQAGSELPFIPRRYFTVTDVPAGAQRGGHAHRTVEQFLVALRGRVTVALDDGASRQLFVLDSPRRALYIPPMIWNDLTDFSPETVLLCLASDVYDEAEYIRSYEAFSRAQAMR